LLARTAEPKKQHFGRRVLVTHKADGKLHPAKTNNRETP
jgi:hypothetical protein